jgi:hypothetical protein
VTLGVMALVCRACLPNVLVSPAWPRYSAGVNGGPRKLWDTQPGLIWSNPNASDSAHIRAALMRPRYGQLLQIATEFGLELIRQEWEELRTQSNLAVGRARPVVERILSHIQEGFARALARD